MADQKEPLNLTELAKQTEEMGATVQELFTAMRAGYIEKNETERQHIKGLAIGAEYPEPNPETRDALEKFAEEKGFDWGDVKFHLRYRARNLKDLGAVGLVKEELKGILGEGYKLSLLPLNLVLPESIQRKFIPNIDYFDEHPAASHDPYGIFLKGAKITDENGNYLASRKSTKTEAGEELWKTGLMNITENCYIGCADCYKSPFGTRELNPPIEIDVGKHRVIGQTKELVEFLNKNPDLYDVIISGGEPLTFDNATVTQMLQEFKQAKDLRILRICTGTLFQGMPFRVDNELLDNLKEFEDRTGKHITFNPHLANHYQLTPEALMAVDRIKQHGFPIYSQVPIQDGINFFKDDSRKTEEYWKELGKRQAIANIEPYKFIVDMHPRTQECYVPLEPLLAMWSSVYDSHRNPELERPKTLSVLMQDGNIIFTGHTLLAMKKEVGNDTVTYGIPLIGRDGKVEKTFTYREPLQSYNSDPKSLDNLRASFFGGK